MLVWKQSEPKDRMEQIDILEQIEHMEETEKVYNVELIDNKVEKQDVAEGGRNMKQR